MRRFTQTNPFLNYTPSVSSTPTYGESAMTPAAPAPANTGSQLSSNQLMGILQMMQNQRNQASQQAPTQQRNFQPDANRRTQMYFTRAGSGPLSSGLGRFSINEARQPYFQLNGQRMNVDQYNDYRQTQAENAGADKAARYPRVFGPGGMRPALMQSNIPSPSNVSLFGSHKAPAPLTQAQFAAKGQYAASRQGTPEQNAYNAKVNALRNSGLNIGYGRR